MRNVVAAALVVVTIGCASPSASEGPSAPPRPKPLIVLGASGVAPDLYRRTDFQDNDAEILRASDDGPVAKAFRVDGPDLVIGLGPRTVRLKDLMRTGPILREDLDAPAAGFTFLYPKMSWSGAVLAIENRVSIPTDKPGTYTVDCPSSDLPHWKLEGFTGEAFDWNAATKKD